MVETNQQSKLVEKRFSKIGGKLCQLKVKVFSSEGVTVVDENPIPKVQEFSVVSDDTKISETVNTPEQKAFSAATIRERVRLAKFSIRQRFRRMILDYKKFNEMSKDNMTSQEYNIVKSLFVSDVMNIMNTITPEIMNGKQINTLLGLSAFGKELRVAGQELQIPYRMAMNEEKRTGAVTKMRYQKIQDAYNKFVHALIDHVFGERQDHIGAVETASAMNEMEDNYDAEPPKL